MNKVITKIQSRLNRRGVKVTLGDIREKYLTSEVLDYDNPTEEELSNIVDYFVRNAVLPLPVDQTEAVNFEEDSGALATATDTELVRSTAQSLGIVLDTKEISEIAANINHSSDDLRDSLDDIKSALVAFVRYKSSLNSQRISEVIEEINDIVADEFSSNSRQLTQGLESINQNMQQQTADFKKKVSTAISAFKVPAAG